MSLESSDDSSRKKRSQTNPRSLANLVGGKKQYYEELKKRRNITVTETGWSGFGNLARRSSLSRSELIESLGRGAINLHLPIKFLTSPEVLSALELSPSQILELPLMEVLKRIGSCEKLAHLRSQLTKDD